MGTPIYMLVDYRGCFYHSAHTRHAETLDIDAVRRYFAVEGYDLLVHQFREIDLRTEDFKGKYVLYQSSEDRGLLYKDYIEDILLALQIHGAVLIPDFYYFRAHHNKVFMELLRDVNPNPRIKNIQSRCFGVLEEYLAELDEQGDQPLVMKPSAGTTSRGVGLAKSDQEKRAYAAQLSRTFFLKDAIKDLGRYYSWQSYIRRSNHRKKFVVQNFVPGLNNDFKILIYGNKYYVMGRKNRPNDFRASGSGRFYYEPFEALPAGLLDFAEEVFESFSTPFLSLDIGFDGHNFYLFEFQFVSFGTVALVKAPYYCIRQGNSWVSVEGTSIVEQDFTQSICQYIAKIERETVYEGTNL